MATSSVIIGHFDVLGVPFLPSDAVLSATKEANAPLSIDADAVLPRTVAAQLFQVVGGWHPQVVELGGGSDAVETHFGAPLDFDRETMGVLVFEDSIRLLVREGPDQDPACNAIAYYCQALAQRQG
jgi:hypothetical protein